MVVLAARFLASGPALVAADFVLGDFAETLREATFFGLFDDLVLLAVVAAALTIFFATGFFFVRLKS